MFNFKGGATENILKVILGIKKIFLVNVVANFQRMKITELRH